MRLAWFSPMPPVATGIARCSADLVAALGRDYDIDVFVDVDADPRDPRPVNADPRNPRDPRLVNDDPRNPRNPRDPRPVNADPRNPRDPRLANGDPRNPRDPRLANGDPRNPRDPRLANGDPRNPRDPRLVNDDPRNPRDPRPVRDPGNPRDPRPVNADPRNPRDPRPVYRDPRLINRDPRNPRPRSAHDFVWRHRRQPYDLIVYQLGNSSHHDYEWPYLFRYPGLVVLHDAHLHHARASCLLRTKRVDDYRREYRANHPAADPNLAELAIAGFDNHLHYFSPMTKLVLERSRLTAVHSVAVGERLRQEARGVIVESIRLGHGVAVEDEDASAMRSAVRARYAIPDDAIVFGCYGGLTPDKRLPQILNAFAATRAYVPSAHLLLAGAMVEHYDLHADVRRLNLQSSTTMTGYLESDDDLTAAIAACDVALNLRWPTAREVSGPWLRCLAAARATITIDLSHLVDVPSLDPRSWCATAPGPCTVAIDIVDEDHSLRLAMRRLATDRDLRTALGCAGRAYWAAHHSVEGMADDYRRVIARAAALEATTTLASPLPDHLLDAGQRTLGDIMGEVGLDVPFDVT